MQLFGERLRELRTHRKMTQKELGQKFKISESSVGMYERGKREPSIDLILQLAEFFQVAIGYLMGQTNNSIETVYSKETAELDLKKALKTLQEKKAFWGDQKLSNSEQEILARILKAVIERESVKD